jgi:hypothetical protein
MMSLDRLLFSLPAATVVALTALVVSCSGEPADTSNPPGTGGSAASGGVTGGAGGTGGATGGTSGATAGTGGATSGTGGATGGAGGATGGAGATAGAGGSVAAGAGGVGPAGAGGTGPAGAGGSGGSAGMQPEPPATLIGDVAFSTPSQTFRDMIAVGMTTAISGAEIRYTVDGTLPTAASTLYAGTPLALTATTQLRAMPFAAGAAAGTVSTAIYIARTFDFTSDLPIVVVDGYGKGKPEDKEVYLDAAVMLFDVSGGMASIASLPTVATRAGYHVRGQSSANFPQTPYKLELWDNANADADYPVFGMPSDSDWALIPPYYDRALVRNPFVYTLGKEMGLEAPRTAYAEVYLNYENRALADTDYQGIYWFSETIKNAEVRTNLKQLNETDITEPAITGGYIFKFDQAAAEMPELVCTGSNPISGGFGQMQGGGGGGTCWVDLEVIDPEPLNSQEQTWLTGYIQAFHDSLHATPIGDYAQYIDVPSFVDYLILNELTRNVDAYVRSAYYHKQRVDPMDPAIGKLKAGPLWDYNFSLAVGGSGTVDPMGGWQFEGTRNVNNWYPKLTADPNFMNLVKARWAALRQNLFSNASLDARITMLAAPLTNAVVRDFAKWPVSTVYPNSMGFVRGPTVPTWAEQIQALRTYVTARTAWMDSQLQ